MGQMGDTVLERLSEAIKENHRLREIAEGLLSKCATCKGTQKVKVFDGRLKRPFAPSSWIGAYEERDCPECSEIRRELYGENKR